MTLPLGLLLAVVTFAVGYVFAALASRMRTAGLAEQRRALGEQLAAAQASLERQAIEIRQLTEARAALDGILATEKKHAEENLRLLADASEQLKSDFKALGRFRAGQQQCQLSSGWRRAS